MANVPLCSSSTPSGDRDTTGRGAPMRLEYLCDLGLRYRASGLALIRPYGGEEGAGYGELDGTVSGARLRGAVRAVNHPRRRGDGALLPDLHGLIETEDGARVLVRLQGRTVA